MTVGLRTGIVSLFGASILALSSVGWPASADGGPHHIYRTDGDGAWLRSVASLHQGLLTVLPDAANFDPDCYEIADPVLGNPVWLHGFSGSSGGFVADYYVDTHWNTLGDLSAQGIPECGAHPSVGRVDDTENSTEAPAVEPAAPVNIQLNVDGAREQNLLALTSELQAAATAASVDGQELARVIYHEGGNYLDSAWRRQLTEMVEVAAPGDHSVGIGQIFVSTARQVDSEIFGADDSGLPDNEIKDRLIYDQHYAIFIAAGYIKIMQDEGLGDGWPQFMAYSLSANTAASWKAAGHPMDSEGLAELGISVSDFQFRQQLYNDTVNAIG